MSEDLNPTIKIDLTITKEDIASMQVSEVRETCMMEQKQIEVELSAAEKKHRAAVDRLTALCELLLAERKNDTTLVNLTMAMETFSGEKFTIEAENETASRSYYKKNEKDISPVIDLNKMRVVGELRICEKDGTVRLSQKLDLPFTNEMKKVVGDIEAEAAACSKIHERLKDAQDRLTDALNPNGLRARVLSQMVQHALEHHGAGSKMLNAARGTKVKALPFVKARFTQTEITG